MSDARQLVEGIISGSISGDDLKRMVDKGEISPTDRRRATKLAKSKKAKLATMSERQKLRLATKEKKMLPKISRDERLARFRKDLESEREREAANFIICLHCRKRGHYVKDCPKVSQVEDDRVFCYNCGGSGHCLRNCPTERDPNGSLPFAQCYICKQSGHLARSCPRNSHGLYPKGGNCHICGSIDHLARDCPDRPADQPRGDGAERHFAAAEGVSDDALLGPFEEERYSEEEEEADESRQKKKRRKTGK